MVFGVLFGEAPGTSATSSGCLRSGSTAAARTLLTPLLLFSLALGAAHVVLGQSLALGQSASARRQVEFVNRSGSLLGLGGVFALAGIATDRIPG